MPSIEILKSSDEKISVVTYGANDRMVVESLLTLFNAYFMTNIQADNLSSEEIGTIHDLIGFAARSVEDAIESQEVESEVETQPEVTPEDWQDFWSSPDAVEYISLGKFLKQRRTALGVTQKEMAALIGISQVYYVKLELGYVKYPSMKVVRLIESVMGEIPPHVVFHKSL